MSAKAKSPKKLAEETNPDFQLPGIGNYGFVKTLGEGNFAKVKLAKHKLTGQEVAIKIIDKTQLDDKKLQKLYREVRIMKLLHHPNIVRLYEVIETKSTVFLVMEYSNGGELYDYLVVHGRMKEKEARAKFRQILSAVSYCHKKKVIHRDLKAENLLLDANLDVKIADFGFSNQYDPDGKLDTFCGSPPYAAPELFQGRRYVGPEVDIWSLGVILYVLTTGCLPFDGKNLQEMRESVCRGKYRIPFYLSDSCEKLLRKFLVRDPTKRTSLDFLADDPWINEGYSESPICSDLSMKISEDENLIKMIEQKFHIDRDSILKSLRDGVYDDVSALYYLMYHERDRTGDYSRVNQVLNSATIPSLPNGGGNGAAGGGSQHTSSMPMSAITLPRMPAGGGGSNPQPIGSGHGAGGMPHLQQGSSGGGSGSGRGGDRGDQQESVTASGTKMMPIAEDSVSTSPPPPMIGGQRLPPPSASSSTARSVSTTPRRRRFTVGGDNEGPGGAEGGDQGGKAGGGPPLASPIDKPGTAPTSPMSPIMAGQGQSGSGAGQYQAGGGMTHTSTLGGSGAAGDDMDGPRKRNNTIVGILRSTMGRSKTADGASSANNSTILPTATMAAAGVPTNGGGSGGNGPTSPPSVGGSTPAAHAAGMMSPPPGGEDANKPRSLRFTFNSNTTSSKPPDEVVASVLEACAKLSVSHKLISRYLIECQYAVPQTRDVVRFEVEVCKLPRLKNLHGLKFKRLSGPSNDYKVVCESLLANVSL
ncbi:hypothetical protein H9P43_006345 [Blastocladiella emersonii ATCC 22665]|nr:hypothetical protein H9P43_006345 [Blastocladiella emersonii ATCC 22665]